jgi:thioredoxin reductase (NADPH)
MAQEEMLSELILRALLRRRAFMIGLRTGLSIIGSSYSADSRRLLEFTARNQIPRSWVDVERDAAAEAMLRDLGVAPTETPVVTWGARMLKNPANAELAQVLSFAPAPAPAQVVDLLVVGAGPAGLAASVYGASEGLSALTVESVAVGGQAGTSTRIENYLGFPAGLSGADRAARAALQAAKFGAQIAAPASAAGLEPGEGLTVVHLSDGTQAGARTRRVYLLVRRDLGATMSRYLTDQLARHPNVEVLAHTEVTALNGDGQLQELTVADRRDGSRRDLGARALFVFIGADPHTGWLPGDLALDRSGFILTGRDAPATGESAGPLPLETTVPGVFAAGDVRSGSIKRVASAVGEGSMAVRLVHDHLARQLA